MKFFKREATVIPEATFIPESRVGKKIEEEHHLEGIVGLDKL